MPLKLLSRNTWDPDPAPQSNFFVHIPAQNVFLMNTQTAQCFSHEECRKTLQKFVQVTRRNHNLKDLRYNFLVGDDGYVYEAKGWYIAPLLPLKFARFSTFSILIGFIGSQTAYDLSETVAEQVGDLIQYGVENSFIRRDFELRNIASKLNTDRRMGQNRNTRFQNNYEVNDY